MQPIVVDLPAPLGPSRPKISPGRAANVTSSTATNPSYSLRRAWTSIKAVLPAAQLPDVVWNRLIGSFEPPSTPEEAR